MSKSWTPFDLIEDSEVSSSDTSSSNKNSSTGTDRRHICECSKLPKTFHPKMRKHMKATWTIECHCGNKLSSRNHVCKWKTNKSKCWCGEEKPQPITVPINSEFSTKCTYDCITKHPVPRQITPISKKFYENLEDIKDHKHTYKRGVEGCVGCGKLKKKRDITTQNVAKSSSAPLNNNDTLTPSSNNNDPYANPFLCRKTNPLSYDEMLNIENTSEWIEYYDPIQHNNTTPTITTTASATPKSIKNNEIKCIQFKKVKIV